MTRPDALLPMLALTLLGGCHARSPADEAIALVDGRPVTRGDLAADLSARRLPAETTSAGVRSAVMAELIDRELLAQEARQDALDQDPGYRAMDARAQERALVQLLLDRWRLSVPAPTRADVQLFMDSNPQMFADRVIYLLDEVQTELKGLDGRALEPLHSIDAVIDYLHDRDHPFRRGSATFDTLAMGLVPARRIARLAPGDPFVSIHGAALIIRAVARSSPAPLVDEQGSRIAAQLWQRAVFQRLLQEKLKTLRAAATITYPAAAPTG